MMTKLPTPINIVLADDHPVFRDGFGVMLNKQSEVKMIGEAADGEELIQLCEALNPDVVITDIKMPKLDGIEATKRLTEALPHIGIIALSMFDEETRIVDMLEAGAKGYLLKNAPKTEIIEAIKAVNEGKMYYCSHTTEKLAQMIAKSSYNPYHKIKKPEFSEKEIAVIHLICQQYAEKEIAEKLHLSIRTIEGYREKILEKMDVKNTAGIVVYAIKNGIYEIN